VGGEALTVDADYSARMPAGEERCVMMAGSGDRLFARVHLDRQEEERD
jgi:hypothetical protein